MTNTKYFIEHTTTRQWWYPVLELDEETQIFKLAHGWTNDPNHPQIGFETPKLARDTIDKYLIDIWDHLIVTDHMFLSVAFPNINRDFS